MEIKYDTVASIDFMLKHIPNKNLDAIASAMRMLTGQSYDAKQEAMRYLKISFTPENLNGEG